MREKYTVQAKKVLVLAEKTAKKCHHSYIGTEHLLLGLLMEPEGTAGILLNDFGVKQEKLLALIDRLIAPGGNTAVASAPGITPRAQRLLENAQNEASRLKMSRQARSIFCLPCSKKATALQRDFCIPWESTSRSFFQHCLELWEKQAE